MSQNQSHNGTFDFGTLAGVSIAVLSLLGGLLLEGGKISDIAQVTAALIVVGGTLGAVLISTPLPTLLGTIRSLRFLLLSRSLDFGELLDQILQLSLQARRIGLPSLEDTASTLEDSFLSKAVGLAADNMSLADIRDMMELDLNIEESRLYAEAKVLETAGGYAPTVGIIGAVLGLIQVMKHLENIDEVGRGIAVSFVATVYGVALANLVLLPAAAKLRASAAKLIQYRECALEGVAGIVESLNTTLLRQKLDPYLPIAHTSGRRKPEPQQSPAPAVA